jgi:hypothetical protein
MLPISTRPETQTVMVPTDYDGALRWEAHQAV